MVTCRVCPQLRPGEPRTCERANVCEGCRARLPALLAELVDCYADLELEKGVGGGAKVTGSRTPPLPLDAHALDLTLPPHPGTVQDDLLPLYDTVEVAVTVWRPARPTDRQYRTDEVWMNQRRRRRDANGWLAYGPSGDQVGDVSVLAVLDSWARDWQSYEWATLPPPTVEALARWLGDRLDWAYEHHPAVEEFAAELADLVGKLRPPRAVAELKVGVPCRQCERVTLYRWPGSDRIECGSCPSLMTVDEYERWTALISSAEHRPWVRDVVASQRPGIEAASSMSGP